MAEKDNSNTEKKTRKKWSDNQRKFSFNSGAAYASKTGDLMGGMGLVFSKSRDLSEEPIIQNIMSGAQGYANLQDQYASQVEEWKSLMPGQKEGEHVNTYNARVKKWKETAPKIEQSTAMAFAEQDYQRLSESGQVRSKMFENAYEELTVNEVKESALYGRLPKNTPDAIIALINANKGTVVGNVEDEKLKTTLDAFKKYHILGNTARDVQGMHLSNTLEALADTPASE